MLFLFFLVIFNKFLTIPVKNVKEKIKVKLALIMATGASIILVNEIIDTHHLSHLKQLKLCLYNQKL